MGPLHPEQTGILPAAPGAAFMAASPARPLVAPTPVGLGIARPPGIPANGAGAEFITAGAGATGAGGAGGAGADDGAGLGIHGLAAGTADAGAKAELAAGAGLKAGAGGAAGGPAGTGEAGEALLPSCDCSILNVREWAGALSSGVSLIRPFSS